MSALAGADLLARPPRGRWTGLLRAGAMLLPATALLLWLFRPEAAAAVAVWRESTAYNHCILVLPIALWLGWERRGTLAWQRPAPDGRLLLLALPGALAWFAAQRLGLMEGRQLAAMGLLQVTALAVLGPALYRRLAAPLLYLVFLVPFGAFVTPVLQGFTSRFITVGLTVLGVPYASDGNIIAIPEGVFLVAEACAGLRFLIACVAFGVLYALTLYRSPGRRLGFVALCVATPVLANGVRALGIVLLGHQLGSAEAAAADHLIYGWVFFSAVIALLVLVGLPLRQDGTAPEPRIPPAAPPRAAPATGLVAVTVGALLLAGAGPAVALLLRAGSHAAALPPGWAPAGCVAQPSSGDEARFACGSTTLLLRGFAATEDPSLLPAAQRRLTGQDGAEDVQLSSLPRPDGAPGAWRLVQVTAPDLVSATAIWVDGEPARSGLRDRLRQAWDGLSGGGTPALLAVLRPDGAGSAETLRATLASPALTTDLAHLSTMMATAQEHP